MDTRGSSGHGEEVDAVGARLDGNEEARVEELGDVGTLRINEGRFADLESL